MCELRFRRIHVGGIRHEGGGEEGCQKQFSQGQVQVCMYMYAVECVCRSTY